MKSLNEKELRVAAGDALVDAIKVHVAKLRAQKMDPEQIKVDVVAAFALDRLGSVGKLVPIGLVNGPDAQ